MPSINLKPDNLNELNAQFDQAPLKQHLFLNSVPKSGSHLLRNIVRMFVPVNQQYDRDFIQYGNLRDHLAAFDGPPAKLAWGHLFHTDISAITTSVARKILLVRDPYTWVLAKARFLLSDGFTGQLDILRKAPITSGDLLSMVIFGIPNTNPSMKDTYTHNAVAWLDTGVHLVRYEELLAAVRDLDSPASKAYLLGLFDACGIDVPPDWKERVKIGSDPQNSGTARQNLSGNFSKVPKELSDIQKQQVDFAAPGLREILGYD
ncbi:hypothetical protein [Altererythrobacter sp. GH1-8]|uniref:hypothetical protein n=1 Tax=Altererythrobacter sp. GH1-8 TaxID=3349333 RepID=UPI00374D04DB